MKLSVKDIKRIQNLFERLSQYEDITEKDTDLSDRISDFLSETTLTYPV